MGPYRAVGRPVDLDLDDLALDDLGLFPNPHTDRLAEDLGQRWRAMGGAAVRVSGRRSEGHGPRAGEPRTFGLAHLEGKHLRGGDHRERHVGTERLGQSCNPRTGKQQDQDSARPACARAVGWGGDAPMAMAVLPVPGCPAMRTARPAILPSSIMRSTTPAAGSAREARSGGARARKKRRVGWGREGRDGKGWGANGRRSRMGEFYGVCMRSQEAERGSNIPRRAAFWPTKPCEASRGSSLSSRPRPWMCECAPVRPVQRTQDHMRVRADRSGSCGTGALTNALDPRQVLHGRDARACDRDLRLRCRSSKQKVARWSESHAA